MTTATGYKLFFRSVYLDAPIVHSDRFYSTILSAMSHLGIFPDSIDSLGFTLSSLFPFYQEYLFFPIPLDFAVHYPATHPIEGGYPLFVSKDVLLGIESNAGLTLLQTNCFIAEHTQPIHIVAPLWSAQTKNGVSSMQFKRDAGLYFLAKFNTDNDKKIFDAALQFLKDDGIGKNRSIGYGQFDVEEFTFDEINQSANRHILLSTYHPALKEIETNTMSNSHIAFMQQTKTPFFTNDKEAKTILFIKEGSVFKTKPKKSAGTTIKLFNQNKKFATTTPIYRIGKAFFI